MHANVADVKFTYSWQIKISLLVTRGYLQQGQVWAEGASCKLVKKIAKIYCLHSTIKNSFNTNTYSKVFLI